MILGTVLSMLTGRGYEVYTKPYELNIVGIRSRHTRANRFDDRILVFYRTNIGWEQHAFPATTDPGTFWLENPIHPEGTAILASGQYKHAYRIGLHQGQYKALVQVAPVNIMRDYDRNAWLDFFNGNKHSGLFGINIHRALSQGSAKYIDRHSAGCQVFENATDFDTFMQICERHKERYGNRFTYTLEDFRAMRRTVLRKAAGIAIGAGIGWTGYEYIIKPKLIEK